MKAYFDGSFRGSNTRDSDGGMRYLHTRKHTRIQYIKRINSKIQETNRNSYVSTELEDVWKKMKKKRIDQNIDIKDHSVANSWFDLNDSYVSTMRQI